MTTTALAPEKPQYFDSAALWHSIDLLTDEPGFWSSLARASSFDANALEAWYEGRQTLDLECGNKLKDALRIVMSDQRPIKASNAIAADKAPKLGVTAPAETSTRLTVPDARPIDKPQLSLRDTYRLLTKGTHPELEGIKLSQSKIAKSIGMSDATISQWLGESYLGNVDLLERKLKDALLALIIEAKLPRQPDEEIFPTYITTRTAGALMTCKKLKRVGVIIGPSGLGRTMGIKTYLESDILAVNVTINPASDPGTKSGMIDAFWAAKNFSTLGYNRKKHVSRSKFICDHFRDQNRLVIIDNAQHLKPGGTDWLAGFHEDTGCPLALVGTPKTLEIIAKAETFPTYVAFRSTADFEDSPRGKSAFAKFADDASQAFASSRWPDDIKIVQPLVRQIIEQTRNLRCVSNNSALAHFFLQTKKASDVSQAFQMAQAQQVKFATKALPSTYKLDMLPSS
jgi:DNA transposition AAA+ family ATPase